MVYGIRHYWNNNCRTSRDRQRFWYKIWVSCGRPKQGVHDCYKAAKKQFRKVRRLAINQVLTKRFNKISMLAKSENGRTFWDKIRKCKPTKDDCSDDIDMDVLVSHFGKKKI